MDTDKTMSKTDSTEEGDGLHLRHQNLVVVAACARCSMVSKLALSSKYTFSLCTYFWNKVTQFKMVG